MEETQLLCGLKREDFQTTIDGKKTDLYVLRNSQGNEVALTNYGGAVVAIMMPDKEGKHANIIQGHDSIKGVMESPEPYLSTLVGRYANRIARDASSSTARSIISPSTTVPTASTAASRDSTPRYGTPRR